MEGLREMWSNALLGGLVEHDLFRITITSSSSSPTSMASSLTSFLIPSSKWRQPLESIECVMIVIIVALVMMWVGGFALYYLLIIRRTPRLFLGAGEVIHRVAARCPSLHRPYSPPVWCMSSWAQALFSMKRVRWFRRELERCHRSGKVEELPFTKEVITLSDQQEVLLHWTPPHKTTRPRALAFLHGEVLLHWTLPHKTTKPRALALLLHGVTGCSYDHHDLAARLSRAGIICVGFDRRGHGGLKFKIARFNTTGDQGDLMEVITLIRDRHPSLRLFAVGYSAGSSLLGRYLGEQGDRSMIDAAVLVSPGFDMEEAILMGHLHPVADYFLTQTAKKLFLDGLTKEALAVPLQEGQVKAIRRLKTCRSMREFHAEIHHFTGHASVDEYFKAQNPAPFLQHIARPTLFINSNDDMMFPRELIRPWTWLAEANENIAMVQTRLGGHCCFYEGPLSLNPHSWAEAVVEEFLTALADDDDESEHTTYLPLEYVKLQQQQKENEEDGDDEEGGAPGIDDSEEEEERGLSSYLAMPAKDEDEENFRRNLLDSSTTTLTTSCSSNSSTSSSPNHDLFSASSCSASVSPSLVVELSHEEGEGEEGPKHQLEQGEQGNDEKEEQQGKREDEEKKEGRKRRSGSTIAVDEALPSTSSGSSSSSSFATAASSIASSSMPPSDSPSSSAATANSKKSTTSSSSAGPSFVSRISIPSIITGAGLASWSPTSYTCRRGGEGGKGGKEGATTPSTASYSSGSGTEEEGMIMLGSNWTWAGRMPPSITSFNSPPLTSSSEDDADDEENLSTSATSTITTTTIVNDNEPTAAADREEDDSITTEEGLSFSSSSLRRRRREDRQQRRLGNRLKKAHNSTASISNSSNKECSPSVVCVEQKKQQQQAAKAEGEGLEGVVGRAVWIAGMLLALSLILLMGTSSGLESTNSIVRIR